MKKIFAFLALASMAFGAQAQLVDVINEVFYTDDGTVPGYPAGATTYRVYARLADGADVLSAVYADETMF